jgi:hypothetical protein
MDGRSFQTNRAVYTGMQSVDHDDSNYGSTVTVRADGCVDEFGQGRADNRRIRDGHPMAATVAGGAQSCARRVWPAELNKARLNAPVNSITAPRVPRVE